MNSPNLGAGWLKGVIQLGLVVGVIALALFLSNSLKPKKAVGRPASIATVQVPVVTLFQPATVAYDVVVRLTGVVENRTQTDIAAEVGGRVVKVSDKFRAGGSVRKDELLFEIDPEQYQLALEQTLAEIAGAKSDLTLLETEAELAINEWKTVYPDRSPPPLAAREPQIGAASARLQAAEASRKRAQLSLDRTRVSAPFDARVIETQLDVGQVLNPNQIVGSTYALNSVEIVAPVSSAELDQLDPVIGREVMLVSTTASDNRMPGKVSRVSATLDSRTRLGRLFIAPEDGAELTIGEFVSIEVTGLTIADAMRIPSSSLTGRNRVWVVNDKQLEARTITVLGVNNGETIVAPFFVADGLAALPPANALDGMTVEVAPTAAVGRTLGALNAGE